MQQELPRRRIAPQKHPFNFDGVIGTIQLMLIVQEHCGAQGLVGVHGGAGWGETTELLVKSGLFKKLSCYDSWEFPRWRGRLVRLAEIVPELVALPSCETAGAAIAQIEEIRHGDEGVGEQEMRSTLGEWCRQGQPVERAGLGLGNNLVPGACLKLECGTQLGVQQGQMIDREAAERSALIADQPGRPIVTPADDNTRVCLEPRALYRCQQIRNCVSDSSSRHREERQPQHPEPEMM